MDLDDIELYSTQRMNGSIPDEIVNKSINKLKNTDNEDILLLLKEIQYLKARRK